MPWQSVSHWFLSHWILSTDHHFGFLNALTGCKSLIPVPLNSVHWSPLWFFECLDRSWAIHSCLIEFCILTHDIAIHTVACKSYFSVLEFFTNHLIVSQLVGLTAIPFTLFLAPTVYSFIYRLYLWASCLLSIHHRCVQALLLPIVPFHTSFIECEFYDHLICTYLCPAGMYSAHLCCVHNIHKQQLALW